MVDWIFEKLQPLELTNRCFDMSFQESQGIFGDTETMCFFKKRIQVVVPKIQYFLRTDAKGSKGATFQPILDQSEHSQTVHVCQGDYQKLLDVMKKKCSAIGGIQIRLIYADPPWGFHSTSKGNRSEDERCEPPENVCFFLHFTFVFV